MLAAGEGSPAALLDGKLDGWGADLCANGQLNLRIRGELQGEHQVDLIKAGKSGSQARVEHAAGWTGGSVEQNLQLRRVINGECLGGQLPGHSIRRGAPQACSVNHNNLPWHRLRGRRDRLPAEVNRHGVVSVPKEKPGRRAVQLNAHGWSGLAVASHNQRYGSGGKFIRH